MLIKFIFTFSFIWSLFSFPAYGEGKFQHVYNEQAEKVILDGKILSEYNDNGYQYLLIKYKKKLYECSIVMWNDRLTCVYLK